MKNALTTKQIERAVAKLTMDDVLSVYSGKDGKCCCGCAGKHSYAARFREEGSKSRGYRVEDSDVNDRMVAKVFNLIKRTPAAQVEAYCNLFSTVVGSRLYILYLRDGRL